MVGVINGRKHSKWAVRKYCHVDRLGASESGIEPSEDNTDSALWFRKDAELYDAMTYCQLLRSDAAPRNSQPHVWLPLFLFHFRDRIRLCIRMCCRASW
jgi:hypothetical protein